MSFFFLKFLLISALILNVTEGLINAKECHEDSDCGPGFSCIFAKKLEKLICGKKKDHSTPPESHRSMISPLGSRDYQLEDEISEYEK